MLSDAQNVEWYESKKKLEIFFYGRFREKTKKLTRIAPRYPIQYSGGKVIKKGE